MCPYSISKTCSKTSIKIEWDSCIRNGCHFEILTEIPSCGRGKLLSSSDYLLEHLKIKTCFEHKILNRSQEELR